MQRIRISRPLHIIFITIKASERGAGRKMLNAQRTQKSLASNEVTMPLLIAKDWGGAVYKFVPGP